MAAIISGQGSACRRSYSSARDRIDDKAEAGALEGPSGRGSVGVEDLVVPDEPAVGRLELGQDAAQQVAPRPAGGQVQVVLIGVFAISLDLCVAPHVGAAAERGDVVEAGLCHGLSHLSGDLRMQPVELGLRPGIEAEVVQAALHGAPQMRKMRSALALNMAVCSAMEKSRDDLGIGVDAHPDRTRTGGRPASWCRRWCAPTPKISMQDRTHGPQRLHRPARVAHAQAGDLDDHVRRLGEAGQLPASTAPRYSSSRLQRQARVVERDDDVGEGQGEVPDTRIAFWSRIQAGHQVVLAQAGEAPPPGRVELVVARAEVAHAAHVGVGQVLLDDLAGVRSRQVHLGDDAVGMPQAIGEGLQPARLLDRVGCPHGALDVDRLGDVGEASLGHPVVGPVALRRMGSTASRMGCLTPGFSQPYSRLGCCRS